MAFGPVNKALGFGPVKGTVDPYEGLDKFINGQPYPDHLDSSDLARAIELSTGLVCELENFDFSLLPVDYAIKIEHRGELYRCSSMAGPHYWVACNNNKDVAFLRCWLYVHCLKNPDLVYYKGGR